MTDPKYGKDEALADLAEARSDFYEANSAPMREGSTLADSPTRPREREQQANERFDRIHAFIERASLTPSTEVVAEVEGFDERSERLTRIHDTLAWVMERTESDECACKPDSEPCTYCAAESALDDLMAIERAEDTVEATLRLALKPQAQPQTCPTCGSYEPNVRYHFHDNGGEFTYWHQPHQTIVHSPEVPVCNDPYHATPPTQSREALLEARVREFCDKQFDDENIELAVYYWRMVVPEWQEYLREALATLSTTDPTEGE